MASENPYEAPASDLSPRQEPRQVGTRYGGIGRGASFGMSVLVGVVAGLLGRAVPEGAAAGSLAIALGQVVAIVAVAGQRIKNLGMSPWWGLTILVPLYNLIVMIRCLAYPEGWADHRTLDATGRVVCGLLVGLVLLMVAVLVAGVIVA